MSDPDGAPADRQVVSQANYARHRGITRQAVSAAIKDGRLRAPAVLASGMIDVDLADAMMNESRVAAPKAATGMASARAAREAANAQMAELQLAERQGKLLPRDRVVACAAELGQLVRTKLAERRQAVIATIATAENPVTALRALDDALCLDLAREAEARLAA